MKTDINSILQFWHPSDPANVDWMSFTSNQTELMWLTTEMELKAQEHSKKTGKPISDETDKRIWLLNRHRKWLAKLRYKFDTMETEIAELKRRNEYLVKQLPKVDFSKLKIHYVDGKLIYKQHDVSKF